MKPVGVFDSGFGGVSFLKKAVELMPEENYIYYGDNAHAPYGDRPEHEINSLSLKCANYLMSRGIKALVVACNTATGTAIRSIRERVSVPVLNKTCLQQRRRWKNFDDGDGCNHAVIKV